MPHKTKKIIILKADVDDKMISIVNWFNKQFGVITTWCCQGSNEREFVGGGEIDLPYISFLCNDYHFDSILRIKKMVADIGFNLDTNERIDFSTEVVYQKFGPTTVYRIGMSGPSVLNKLNRLIEEKN